MPRECMWCLGDTTASCHNEQRTEGSARPDNEPSGVRTYSRLVSPAVPRPSRSRRRLIVGPVSKGSCDDTPDRGASLLVGQLERLVACVRRQVRAKPGSHLLEHACERLEFPPGHRAGNIEWPTSMPDPALSFATVQQEVLDKQTSKLGRLVDELDRVVSEVERLAGS